jgi:hypothetical protein
MCINSTVPRFPPHKRPSLFALIKPCIRFSRTRLSDVLHTNACADFQGAFVGSLKSPYRP